MKCSLCGGVAVRLGTKGRGYCSKHTEKAWAEVKKEGDSWDARHQHDWTERRRELHQDHLARTI